MMAENAFCNHFGTVGRTEHRNGAQLVNTAGELHQIQKLRILLKLEISHNAKCENFSDPTSAICNIGH